MRTIFDPTRCNRQAYLRVGKAWAVPARRRPVPVHSISLLHTSVSPTYTSHMSCFALAHTPCYPAAHLVVLQVAAHHKGAVQPMLQGLHRIAHRHAAQEVGRVQRSLVYKILSKIKVS